MESYDKYIVFLLSFVVSIILIPIIIKISDKNGFHDYTNERKIHKGKISRLGGLAIFAGFAVSMVYLLIFDFKVQFNVPLFLIAMVLAFITGFIDDLFRVKARYKLILQLICGLLVGFSGLLINKITIISGFDINFGIFAYIITMFWVSGFMNAINMLDGMDGLASGVVIIATIFLGIIGYLQGMIVVTFLSIALIGSIAGFLVFNYPPAKIFMGDGGAYFLGFMYAVLPLIGIKKASTLTLFLIPLILLMIPVLDMIHVVQNRFMGGYHIFLADRSHIHHRLLHIGFTYKGILWVLYCYTALLGSFAVLMVYLIPLHSLLIMIMLSIVTLLTFYTISVAEKRIEELESGKRGKK